MFVQPPALGELREPTRNGDPIGNPKTFVNRRGAASRTEKPRGSWPGVLIWLLRRGRLWDRIRKAGRRRDAAADHVGHHRYQLVVKVGRCRAAASVQPTHWLMEGGGAGSGRQN